ncbi:OPT family oligopeptide transporter [[Clostridium] polysaccharolyticum]|uniref:Putative oligopeptide transporter, OPT family n=1 Tax=[Clostridium] polysaccharolyticum TaxID=29364 RepID=A0A1I0DEZ8_9FIRM|nr:oligopeptide transporter, OPT family [[Clostridium] polysaccharolyticum]SET30147.1 putative oligopeptide transporter, OPT family [[Clostridium] polysaccharolyticum]
MEKKLPKGAYGDVDGKEYIPYVTQKDRTGGNGAVFIIGAVLAILFAASTAYSGMKSGLTVAAGIPGSIIGSGLVAVFAKRRGILGKNIVQGMASGGESIASGIIFLLPAVILIGKNFTFWEGFLVSAGGVLFGIGVSSFVYKNFIVEEHGNLMYPEALAISETLVASEGAGESMKYMGIGFAVGGLLTVVSGSFLNMANTVISYVNERFYKWKLELEVNPLLLGIGFIVGVDVAVIMFAGSVLANFAVLPLISYFSGFAREGAFIWNNDGVALSSMMVNHISGSYVKYIGAGMMLSGGLIGAIRLIPAIVSSVRETVGAKKEKREESSSFASLMLLIGIAIGFVTAFLISGGNLWMAILGAVFSFVLSLLFVIVSGRLTGTIGTSNLPVSGMTIASLVILTLLFVIMGWKGAADNKILLLFGTFIVTAISVAGGYCQSQKVTYLIGGKKEEMDKYFAAAGIIGVFVVIGVIKVLSDQLAMTGDNVAFALPQANLISTLTAGIMSGELPWHMIIVGVVFGIVLYLLKLPIMTVAIGFYLPIATTSIILAGALVRLFLEKTANSEKDKEIKVENGISLSSGLVAGGSIIGLIGIVLQVSGWVGGFAPSGFLASNGMAYVLLVLLLVFTIWPLMSRKKE